MLIQWQNSDNPCLRIGNYKGKAYYLCLSTAVKFRGGLVDGKWEAHHGHVAKVSLFVQSSAVGLEPIEAEEELGEMRTGDRRELFEWVEQAQMWAENLLVSPMQRLADRIQLSEEEP